MVYTIFSGVLVESYGTWLLFQRLDDASKDSDIPKNVPFAFAINNRNTTRCSEPARCLVVCELSVVARSPGPLAPPDYHHRSVAPGVCE
jgi:hypothetical protein